MNPMLLSSLVFNYRERNPDTWYRNESDYIMRMPGSSILRGPSDGKCKNILRDFQQHWSLLKTYLTHPPCCQAWITYRALRVPSRVSQIHFSGLLQIPTGITMGRVLNAPSFVRGIAEVQRLVPEEGQPRTSQCTYSVRGTELEPEVHSDVIMNEILESLHAEDGEPVVLFGHFRCNFLDVIVARDRMRAGVAPYAENAMEPEIEAGGQSTNSGDEGWATDSEWDSDEELDDLWTPSDDDDDDESMD
jgi:hypothetical protein